MLDSYSDNIITFGKHTPPVDGKEAGNPFLTRTCLKISPRQTLSSSLAETLTEKLSWRREESLVAARESPPSCESVRERSIVGASWRVASSLLSPSPTSSAPTVSVAEISDLKQSRTCCSMGLCVTFITKRERKRSGIKTYSR